MCFVAKIRYFLIFSCFGICVVLPEVDNCGCLLNLGFVSECLVLVSCIYFVSAVLPPVGNALPSNLNCNLSFETTYFDIVHFYASEDGSFVVQLNAFKSLIHYPLFH